MSYGFEMNIKENTVKKYTYGGKDLWLGLFVSDDHGVKGRNKTAYEIMIDNCFNKYSFNINTYCMGDVDPSFGKDALETAHMIFVTFDSNNGEIAGPRAFMCVKKNHLSWTENGNGFYYIELICSAKTKRLPNKDSPPGKALLNALKTYVKEENGAGIGLKAINTVISYYARLGWNLHSHGNPCGEEEEVQRGYPLRSVELVNWLHTNRLTKENEKVHGEKYKEFVGKLPKGTPSEMNAQWQEFKNDCAPEKGVEPDEECADDFIIYNQWSKEGDGAPMIWCNPAKKGGRKKRRRKKKRTKKRKKKRTKKRTKKKTKKYRTRKQLDGIWKRNTRKAKCSRLKKGSWAKKKKHCLKNDQCFWSGQRDICSSKKMY